MRRAWRAAPRARWVAVAVAGRRRHRRRRDRQRQWIERDRAGRPAAAGQGAPPPGTDLAALRGKPALVDFFASWCDPCAEEAPELRKLAASLGDRATVVAVDWDDAGGPARAFVKKHGWTFPVLADTSGRAGESYGLVGLPTSFVLDPQGRIVATFRGPQTAATLRQALLEAS